MTARRRDAHDPHRAERRQILRRAALYTYGFWVAAVVIAVLGAAVIAWLLSRTGLPFRETWFVVSIIILVVPLIGMGVGAIRRRREDGGRRDNGGRR